MTIHCVRQLEASREIKQEQAGAGSAEQISNVCGYKRLRSAVRGSKRWLEEIARRDAVPQEIASALPEEASEAEWQEKVDRAGARINRLGPINLGRY